MKDDKIRNICRPISLYNKQVPATAGGLECDYVVFGEYDGLTIHDNIFTCDQKESYLFRAWLSLINESESLKGKYVIRTLFALRNESEDEAFTEEKFFSLEGLPFMFLVMLQYKEYYVDLGRYVRHMEMCINSQFDIGDIRVIGYLTLDNSDIVLLIKARTYDLGRKVINDLHNPNNVIKDRSGNTLTLNNSFTTVGFSKTVLNDEEEDFSAYDGPIDQVMICAMERSPGSVQGLRKAIEKQADKPIPMYENLGNDDEIFLWEKTSWSALLPLYRSENGPLTDEYNGYLDWVHSVVTIIRASESENAPGVLPSFSLNTDALDLGGKLLDQKAVEGICQYYRDLVQKDQKKEEENASLEYTPELAMRLALKKTLLHILNSLEKYEHTDFPCYLFVSIFEPLKQFIKLLYTIGLDSMEPGDQNELNFLNSINILIQNPNGIDRQFLQAPDFNAGIFNVPVKLEAFYSAYVYDVTKLYNSLRSNSDTKHHIYKFLLCPWVGKQTQSVMMFQHTPPGNRVILIRVPEQLLFNPKCFMIILGHEVGHYVGGDGRMRGDRYKVAKIVIINGILKYWFESAGLNQYVDESVRKECRKFLLEKCSEAGKEEFKYHSYYMRRSIKKVIKNTLDNDLDHLKEIIIHGYFDKTAADIKENLSNKCSYEEFIKTNKERLQEQESGYANFKDVWDKSLIYLLGNNGMINSMIDSVLDTLIECFADLISIIALDLSPEQYLESFFSTMDHPENTVLIIRLCMVTETMRLDRRDINPDSMCWDEAWNSLSERVPLTTAPENMGILVSHMSEIMLQVDEGKTLNFLDKGKEDYKEYRIFEDIDTWKLMKGYLDLCKRACEGLLYDQEEPLNRRKDLVALYRSMCNITSVEETVAKMEDKITSYTAHVFSKGASTS